ncbi:MAG: sigma-70 family RNA polymerase sigma factor [Thiobacillus sp.]|nr:sigma-70 family RNA polymerase sigma factor [Thiobacillus sp.]
MQKDSILRATDPDEWLESHGDALFRFAMKHLHDSASAEDVVQETLLAALQTWDRFAGNASERTWLTSILKHKIADLIHKQSRESPFENDVQDSHGNPAACLFDQRGEWVVPQRAWGDPDAMYEQNRFWEAFTCCYDGLSPKLATAFSLREFSGFSIDELCEILNISSSNCSVILYRARLALKACLESGWFDNTIREGVS